MIEVRRTEQTLCVSSLRKFSTVMFGVFRSKDHEETFCGRASPGGEQIMHARFDSLLAFSPNHPVLFALLPNY